MKEEIKVLVVEDENIVALDIQRGLMKMGYKVLGPVSTAEAAIDLALHGDPQLVLMDVQLKGPFDGIHAAEIIKKSLQIPLIFLTAYADEKTLNRAKSTEPYGYLLKPFEESELHTAIEVVLEKHRKIVEKQHLSEYNLILSEERFRLFVDSVKDYAIFMLDEQGNIISWNKGAERIKGYRADEVIGKSLSIFYTEEEKSQRKEFQDLQMALEHGTYELEGWRVRKDGGVIWANVIITALRNENGKLRGFGKVTRDLTEQRKTAIELQNAVKARDEFLSIASHELKTPLTSLKLQLELLKLKQPVTRNLEVCLYQVDRLSGLIESLLDVSRFQSGMLSFEKESLNLADLVTEVLHNYDEPIKAAKMPMTLQHQEVNGQFDRHRMEQLLVNLLSNATKYASGAPLDVAVGPIQKADKLWAFLQVKDQGEGIAAEDIPNIFKLYQRGKNTKISSGLGLGLYICKQIVEGHHGHIQVTSVPHEGTNFYMEFPIG